MSWVRATHRDAVRAGEVVVVSLAPDRDGRPREALVLLDEAGSLRAYMNRCEHVPIPLDGGSREFFDEEGHLRCGTHGALYRRSDGLCVLGPCRGRSLEALALRVGPDGVIEVDGR